LLGNHQQNHQLAVADQAVQADLAADDHRVARADLAADPVLVNDWLIQTIRISKSDILPLFFSYGEMRNSNE
jgi:hypothetical protein